VTAEDVFAAWAPDSGRWSRWAKPVLFAHVDALPANVPALRPASIQPDWHAGIPTDGTALVIELPGAQAVVAGVSAADLGFRPVPLFNAIPGPAGDMPGAGWLGKPLPIAAVDVHSVVRALVSTAPRLRGGGPRGAGLAPDAPPAFLVDSRRLDGRGPLRPGRFDNRSALSDADFPSASRLQEAGIRRVVVVLDAKRPMWDLLPVLQGWRRAGLAIELKPLDQPMRAWPGVALAWLWVVAAWLRRLTLVRRGRRGFGGWVTGSGG
jgi:hypothetical protein